MEHKIHTQSIVNHHLYENGEEVDESEILDNARKIGLIDISASIKKIEVKLADDEDFRDITDKFAELSE